MFLIRYPPPAARHRRPPPVTAARHPPSVARYHDARSRFVLYIAFRRDSTKIGSARSGHHAQKQAHPHTRTPARKQSPEHPADSKRAESRKSE
ncbi:MAG: hypothetical protein QM296_03975 [Bacillota bacterium]|nr:hypothetical protein [Bacillota bacterium]